MPGGVSGPDLAHWIEDHAPEIAIVLMTGYDDGLQATECPDATAGSDAPADHPHRQAVHAAADLDRLA